MSATDYRQSAVMGTSWQRAERIIVENPLPPGVPAVTFVECKAINVGGSIITQSLGNLVEPLIADGEGANIRELFQPVDPATMQAVGDPVPYGYAAAIVAGLYLHAAAKRDAAQAAQAPADE